MYVHVEKVGLFKKLNSTKPKVPNLEERFDLDL